MAQDDLAYYRTRADAELEQARTASHPSAAAAHAALASEYLKRVGAHAADEA